MCLTHDQLSPSRDRLILSLPPSKIRRRHRRKILLNPRNPCRIPHFEIQILPQRAILLRTTPWPNYSWPQRRKAALGSAAYISIGPTPLPPPHPPAGGRLDDACRSLPILRNRRVGRCIMIFDGVLTNL